MIEINIAVIGVVVDDRLTEGGRQKHRTGHWRTNVL